MSSEVLSMYALEWKLRAASALAIGSGDPDVRTDAPVLRDHLGRPMLAPTSLLGYLRSRAARLAAKISIGEMTGDALVAALFGEAVDGVRSRTGRPSRLEWVAGALSASPHGQSTHVRDRVGIDRTSGAAASALKYDLEVVARGSEFDVHLRFGDDGSPQAKAALTLLLMIDDDVIARGVRVGRSTSTGLGHLECIDSHSRTIQLREPDEVRQWLRARTTRADAARSHVKGESAPPERQTVINLSQRSTLLSLHAAVTVECVDPIFFGGSTPEFSPRESNTSHRPDGAVLRDLGGAGVPIASGSALRGALRTRAEQILRTHLGLEAACCPNTTAARSDPAAGARPRCGDLEFDDEAANHEGLAPSERADRATERAEFIRSSVCVACRLFGSTHLGGRVVVDDVEIFEPITEKIDFVAIDRFTAGAVDAKKFDREAVVAGHFDVGVTLDDPAPWEVALVTHVLRDVAEQWLPLGGSSTRGFGRVRATNSRLEPRWLTADGRVMTERFNGTGSKLFGFDEPLDAVGEPLRELVHTELSTATIADLGA